MRIPRRILQGKNKFNALTCKCLSKHIHHSRGEAGYCDFLLSEKKDKRIKDYQSQVQFKLVVNRKIICNHIVDFLVQTLDGKQEVHEYKGFATDVWRLKKNLFEATIPHIPYLVIKHR